MEPRITWYGHSAFKIEADGHVVYFDPFKLPPTAAKADALFISHEHFDHCSVEDFGTIRKDTTDIIAPAICSDKFLTGRLHIVKPGDTLELNGVAIEVVAAYNTDKNFHPKEDFRVGYIVTMGGQRIYHAGDTDLIPEMSDMKVDIALLPISGVYVMNAEQAADAAKKIKPKVVIPMHYGTIVGNDADVVRFKSLVPSDIEVRVLEKALG